MLGRTARSLGPVLGALSCAMWTSVAVAQAPPAGYGPPGYPALPGYPPPPGYAPLPAYWPPMFVDLASLEPGVRISIYPEKVRLDSTAPIAECASPPCRVGLYPGRYQLHVSEGPDTLSGTRTFEVKAPSIVAVDPDTNEHRNVGLALGIVGPAMIIGGMAIALSNPCYQTSCSYREEETRIELGIFTLLAGLALTPIGWVMYGTSFKPEVEVTPLLSSSRREPRAGRVHRSDFAADVRF